MYPYHNRIKQRIRNGELVRYEFVDDYREIGECLLLWFCTDPAVRPVRPNRYWEYADLLDAWNRSRDRGRESGGADRE